MHLSDPLWLLMPKRLAVCEALCYQALDCSATAVEAFFFLPSRLSLCGELCHQELACICSVQAGKWLAVCEELCYLELSNLVVVQ